MKNIVAFTGAGISKASGISTFEEVPEIRNYLTREFANEYPEEYTKLRTMLCDIINDAEPNDAHLALAEYNIPIITMNIDSLHEKAGSTDVIHVHGNANADNLVLYGDTYADGILEKCCELLEMADIVIIIGTSYVTSISLMVKDFVENCEDKTLIEINESAETVVRETLIKLLK